MESKRLLDARPIGQLPDAAELPLTPVQQPVSVRPRQSGRISRCLGRR
jgi:hypothetical protein